MAARAFIILPFVGLLLGLNLRLHDNGDSEPSRVVAHLRALRTSLESGAAEDMQALFPEGYFFTYGLYGAAWVQVARRWPQLGEQALKEARWALEAVDSSRGREPFSEELSPPYGVFYVGWTAWFYAEWLSLSEPVAHPRETARFVALCEQIAHALGAASSPFLASYPDQRWPTDTVVAVAALAQHDRLRSPRFEEVTQQWVLRAQNNLDPQTGLLPHRVAPFVQGARATSQTIIHRFLPFIDEAWAREQYRSFRQQFVGTAWPLIGVREYPVGVEGEGDVDSGPLVRGMSASASVVAMGAALQHGDHEVAEAFWGMTEALGMAWGTNERKYAFGWLPVSDAFILWSQTGHAATPQDYPSVLGWWWRWSLHLVSAVAALLVVLLGALVGRVR